jgi:hypothetical protein
MARLATKLSKQEQEELAQRYGVQTNIVESLNAYATTLRPTGSFLHSVLANNLKEAVGRADVYNQRDLVGIVTLLYNEMPSTAWGSPERVEAWLTREDEVAETVAAGPAGEGRS